MVKSKISPKQKEKAFLAFSVIVISFLCVWSIFAQTVPQKIGFKDVTFSSLTKEVCQECHSGSLADTHHSTKEATSGNCVSCHRVQTQPGSVGVSVERNCMTCHEKSPHHTTESAQNKECTSCHSSSGVSDYSTEVPSYAPSKVTPKPGSCGNCHGEGEVDGQKVVSSRDTHHGLSLTDCNICHDEASTGGEQSATSIRICERCHNVKVLHEVEPHVEKESCALCHGGKTTTAQPATTQPATEQPEEE